MVDSQTDEQRYLLEYKTCMYALLRDVYQLLFIVTSLYFLNNSSIYETGFAKTCIDHASNLSTLKIHKIYLGW